MRHSVRHVCMASVRVRVRFKGDITVLARGLLHKNLPDQKPYYEYNVSPGENFPIVRELRSTGGDPMNACSHPKSRASLYATICLQFAYTPC